MDRPVETELKLAATPAMLDQLRSHPQLRQAERQVATTTSYYDTPGGSLRRADASVRLRSSETGAEQTLKLARPGCPAISREEWTVPAMAERLDLTLFPEPARAALAPLLGGNLLACIARMSILRTTRRLRHGRSLIEVAFDRGTIHARDLTQPVSELELELVEGHACDLLDLALQLPLGPDLQWSVSSKGERAHALAFDLPPVATRAAPLALPGEASLAAALRAIGWSGLHHLLANAPLVLSTGDPEAVHQVRVALRRLRAALVLYRPGPAARVFAAELQAAARELAPARDLFLLRRRVDDQVGASQDDRSALPALLTAQGDAALATARRLLAGESFQRLLLRLGCWLEASDGLAATRRAGKPFAPIATKVLRHRLARLVACPHSLDRLSIRALHRLRKAGKTLRQAAQFCPLPDHGKGAAKHRQRLLTALEHLQASLGELNDLAFARHPPMDLFAGHDAIDAARWRAELTGLFAHQGRTRRALLSQAQHAFDQLRAADRGGRGR